MTSSCEYQLQTFRLVFINWWALENFQWASNLVILQSFTTNGIILL